MNRRDQRGTAALEVIGLAPLVLLLTLVLLYSGLALYGITATQTAARQAARAESLGENPYGAAGAALPGWLQPVSVDPQPVGDGGTRISVTTDLPDLLPGTDLLVTRSAAMP